MSCRPHAHVQERAPHAACPVGEGMRGAHQAGLGLQQPTDGAFPQQRSDRGIHCRQHIIQKVYITLLQQEIDIIVRRSWRKLMQDVSLPPEQHARLSA